MTAPGRTRSFRIHWAVWMGVGLLLASLAFLELRRHLPFGTALTLSLEWGAFWLLVPGLAVLLTQRYPLGRTRWAVPLAVHALAGSALAALHLVRAELRGRWLREAVPPDVLTDIASASGFDALAVLVAYGLVAGGVHAVAYTRWSRQKELRAVRLESELARTELEEVRSTLRALRLELNPHVLLSGLNATMALMDEDPAGAQRILVRLGDLLRRLLLQRDAEVYLEDELELLRGFVELERERAVDRLDVDWRVPDELLDARVPAMILQPLVENAVSQIVPRGGGRLVVEAERSDARLELRVYADGTGLDQATGAAGPGAGLANVRQRLRRLYGGAAELVLEPVEGGLTRARISLPPPSEAASAQPSPTQDGDEPRSYAQSDGTAAGWPPARRIAALALLAWFLVFALFTFEGGRARVGPGGEPIPAATALGVALYVAALLTGFAYAVFRITARLLRTGRRWRIVLGHAIAAPALNSLVAIAYLAILPFVEYQRGPATLFETGLRRALGLLPVYALLAATAHAVAYARRYRNRELRAARLEAELARTELQETRSALRALQLELNPHFLLNGLNGAMALMHEDPAAARRMLGRLGELLRRLLLQREAEVRLEDELEVLRSFVELERDRVGGRLDVRYRIPQALLHARVPAMILQPLVENAVRHGIAPRGGGRLVVEAERSAGRLELRVHDDGVGLQGAAGTSGTGVGLRNVRERLRRMYGARAELALEPAKGRGTCATVSLPWSEATSSIEQGPDRFAVSGAGP